MKAPHEASPSTSLITPEITSFAEGTKKDIIAAQNGITYDYNNGLAEGSVNKVKVIKRLDKSGEGRNLTVTSEAGQYYALLFGELDLQDPKYKVFMENVREGFKNRTDDSRIFVPVNAFIGFYLRICVLMQLGEKQILKEDIKAFFGGMADSTGTLWEYKEHKGSYDHGFASMAALAIVFAEGE